MQTNAPVVGLPLDRATVEQEAVEFLNEMYTECGGDTTAHASRIDEVRATIASTGTYEHTYDELLFGVRTTWRNASRCIMRSHWNTLGTHILQIVGKLAKNNNNRLRNYFVIT